MPLFAVFCAEGTFVPIPFLSTAAAERLFRHKVIAMLRDKGLLTEERIELLMSWRHSGFSAHNAVTVSPGDTGGIERLARYLLRAPAALDRLELDHEGRSVRYQAKSPGARPQGREWAGRSRAPPAGAAAVMARS